MPLSNQVPQHLVYGAEAGFLAALSTMPSQWQRIAQVYNLDAKSRDLVDLGAAPMPTEAQAGGTFQDYIEKHLEVEEKSWEIVVGYSYNAESNDQTDALERKVRGAGANFQRHIDKSVFQALNTGDGTTWGLCYDGQYFFDTDHADEGAKYATAQANLGTSTLDLDAFDTAMVAAQDFLDDQGEYYGTIPNILLVPPALRRTGHQLVANPSDYGTVNRVDNTYVGQLDLMVSPYLDSTAWILLDTSREIKPVILVMREQPNLQAAWFEPLAGDGGIYYFKFYARYNVAYGDWRLAYMGKT